MRHRSPAAAAALLIVAMSPSTAWAHNWGGAAFIVAFNMMIAIPATIVGLLGALLGGRGAKNFIGSLMIVAIMGCIGLWLLVVSESGMTLIDHATVLAPALLPALAAWLCLRTTRAERELSES